MTVVEGCRTKKIKFLSVNNSDELQLKKTDIYYYQVQGQLHVANKQTCYFVVWTPKGKYNSIITSKYLIKFLHKITCYISI